jgi:hypothetical protein
MAEYWESSMTKLMIDDIDYDAEGAAARKILIDRVHKVGTVLILYVTRDGKYFIRRYEKQGDIEETTFLPAAGEAEGK